MTIFYLNRHEIVEAILSNNGSQDSCPYFEDRLLEDEETGGSSYEFKIPADHPVVNKINEDGYIVRKDLDGALIMFSITKYEDDHTDSRFKYIYAEVAGLELLFDTVRPAAHYAKTPAEILDILLAETRWQRGKVDYFGVADYIFEDYQNTVSAIQYTKEVCQGKPRYRVVMKNNQVAGRYVDMLQRRGVVSHKRFTHGKDITGIKRTIDYSDVVTALIGVGRGDSDGKSTTFESIGYYVNNGDPFSKPLGQDWVGDDDALRRFGIKGKHRIQPFEYDTDEPLLLLQKTWEELQRRKNPAITYELEVALLERLAGYEHEKVRIGDTVYVNDETFQPALLLEATVKQLETSFCDPSQDKCVLGNFVVAQSNITKAMREIQSKLLRKQTQWDAGTDTYTWFMYADTETGEGISPYPAGKNYLGVAYNKETEEPSMNPADYQWSLIKGEKGDPGDQGPEGPEGPQGPPGDVPPIDDGAIEDVLPPKVTNVKATGLFKNVLVQWDLVDSIAIAGYEVYASQVSGFTPASTNLVFRGRTNSYVHATTNGQVWYFKVRAFNTHATYGAYSDEATGTTARIVTDDMLFGSVNTGILADLAVDASKLAGQAVTAEKIANLAVGNAAIQNLAVTNSKIGNLAVGNAQIQDLAVTNAKIGNLAVDDAKIANVSVDKLKAGTIDTSILNIFGGSSTEYTKIIGSYLESFGRFSRTWQGSTTVNDIAIRFEKGYQRLRNNTKNRSLYISDFGLSTQIDGTNSSGVIEFFSDEYNYFGTGITVQSESGVVALKTYGQNPIIIHPSGSSYAEVRGILMAQFFRTNTTNAYMGVDPGGELRVTNQDFNQNGEIKYQNVHAFGYKGNWLQGEPNANVYVATDGELRVTSRGMADNDPIIYRDVKAKNFNGDAFITSFQNGYLGCDGEFRFVNKGFNPGGAQTFRDARGQVAYFNAVEINGLTNSTILYMRASEEVQATKPGTTNSYIPFRAKNFITDTSQREKKKDIVPFKTNVLDYIAKGNAYLYRRDYDEADAKKQLGLMLDELPEEVYSPAGDSIDLYGLCAFLYKGMQELSNKIQTLETA